ncbi:MAG: ASCH domain-containing protein [Myxococcales bacterium]|nr:MAG: ASCH domain-containing protein [Myxococcales bacterium]
MIHKIHCQEPWFSLIREGKKPVEGRKASSAYLKIKPGDNIEFFCGGEMFQAQVVGVNRYESLEKYLETETLERALPGVSTIDEGVRIYLQWSTKEQILKHGFLGIQVRVK